MIRIGTGFDAHAFATSGSQIVLGGIVIPHTTGIAAHSDGDVLLHALCDALLGAAACGDIGQRFPSTAEHKDTDSSQFLKKTMQLIAEKSWSPINIDAIIIAQTPKMQPFIGKIRQNIANLMEIELDCVSIKASTTDRLGFIGRSEGIATIVSALLQKKS